VIRLRHQYFGTHPIVAHCPGPTVGHFGWHTFVNAALSGAANPEPSCESVTLLTWHGPNRPHKPNGLMERSAARFGAAVRVLQGRQEGWVNRDKLALTADALREVDTEFVIGVDTADVMLLDHPDEIVRRFRERFDCELLFNATGSGCWPPLPGFIIYESSRPGAKNLRGRCWLNSGCWVGRTEFCRRYFTDATSCDPVEGYECSDQATCKRIWPRWYPQVQIDGTCEIFGWFNERRDVLTIERPRQPRQDQLIDWLHNLGRARYGAEIGVFDGSTSEALLREFHDLRLWMVDSWKPYDGSDSLGNLTVADMERIRGQAEWWTSYAANRRHLLRLESCTAARYFPEGSLDFAFVDANHQYDSVATDIRAWWGAVRPGGLLCGHDYGVYGDATGAWGVKRAVNEFAARLSRTVRLGRDGMWSIVR